MGILPSLSLALEGRATVALITERKGHTIESITIVSHDLYGKNPWC